MNVYDLGVALGFVFVSTIVQGVSAVVTWSVTCPHELLMTLAVHANADDGIASIAASASSSPAVDTLNLVLILVLYL